MSNLGAATKTQPEGAGSYLGNMRSRRPIEQDRQRRDFAATGSTDGTPRMAGDALGEAAKEIESTTAAKTQNNAPENSRPMIQGFPTAPVSPGRQENSRDNESDDDKERAKQFLKDKTTGSENKESHSESDRRDREAQHQSNWQARRQVERQAEDEDRARRSGQQGTTPVVR
jgi:hypothetical protein